jgi:hypothetical protein
MRSKERSRHGHLSSGSDSTSSHGVSGLSLPRACLCIRIIIPRGSRDLTTTGSLTPPSWQTNIPRPTTGLLRRVAPSPLPQHLPVLQELLLRWDGSDPHGIKKCVINAAFCDYSGTLPIAPISISNWPLNMMRLSGDDDAGEAGPTVAGIRRNMCAVTAI